jgi:hypothetical protein
MTIKCYTAIIKSKNYPDKSYWDKFSTKRLLNIYRTIRNLLYRVTPYSDYQPVPELIPGFEKECQFRIDLKEYLSTREHVA